MVDMTLAQWRLAELAIHYPGATAVLFKNQLDFCQAGQTRLADAAVARQLDIEALISTLSKYQTQADDTDWSQYDSDTLIAHILHRYHERHRQQFPELIRLAERVELDNVNHAACPSGLALLLMDMQFSLETHMQKEEQVLFPIILSGTNRLASAPLSRMREEDEAHQADLQQLQLITHQFTPPRDASITWQALYNNLQWLHRDLQQHIQLENDILFARVEHDHTSLA